MVNFTEGGISLNHLVVFDEESKIFAAGRQQQGTRHVLKLFLVNIRTGDVYSRNGRAETWEAVDDISKGIISDNVLEAYRNRTIPVYRTHGNFA
jgi:hypothetical protein